MSIEAYICTCGVKLDGAALTAAVQSFDAHQSLYRATCPQCSAGIELRVSEGRIGYGYTYWAGSMHFDEVGVLHVPGLAVKEAQDRDVMVLGLEGKTRELPVAPAVGYLSVQAGDRAVGQTLDALALEALGVEVRGLQAPGYVPVALDRRLPLSAGMRVEIFGPLSARRRAESQLRRRR